MLYSEVFHVWMKLHLVLSYFSGENYGRSKAGDGHYGGGYDKAESNGRPEYDGPPGMEAGGVIEVGL